MNFVPVLTLIIAALPVAAAIGCVLAVRQREAVRGLALSTAALSAVLTTLLGFLIPDHAITVLDIAWIPQWYAHVHLAVDPLSHLMLWLTAFTFLLAVLASLRDHPANPALFHGLLFLVQAALYGVFLARDLLLFFVCYELVLIPMYLVILFWGGANRARAAMKFLLFTVVGSLPLLFALVAIGVLTWQKLPQPSFDFAAIRGLGLDPRTNLWLFAGFAFAFLVKTPLWPLHTWLPDAHTEAPTAGSIVLAGALLKMGAYGLMAVAIPLFPDAAYEAAPLLKAFALCGILCGALAAWAQEDAKRMVAYSSVSHMGFVALGLFTFTPEGWLGAGLQMVAHGVTAAALFFAVGALYRRRGDRALARLGGAATLAPGIATWTGVAMLSAMALPGTAGFAAEFLVLYGAMLTQPLAAVAALIGTVFAAAYGLRFLKAVLFAEPDAEMRARRRGEGRDEIAALALAGVLLLAAGLAPHALAGVRLVPYLAGLVELLP